MGIPNFSRTSRQLIFAAADICSITFALFLATFIYGNFSFGIFNAEAVKFLLFAELLLVPSTLFLCYLFRLYNSVWTFVGVYELFYCICVSFFSTVIFAAYGTIAKSDSAAFSVVACVLYFFIFLSLLAASRFAYRFFRTLVSSGMPSKSRKAYKNVMLIGAGSAGLAILREIASNENSIYRVCCIIDDNESKWGRFLFGTKIVGGRDRIPEFAQKNAVEEIFIAIPSASSVELRKIIDICHTTSCKLKTLPSLNQLIDGTVGLQKMRDVRIEDLLGRSPIKSDLGEIMSYVKDKVVMVTGGGGSIGSELCRQIAAYSPKQLIIVDIYENNAYEIQQELVTRYPSLDLVVLIASVRNSTRIRSIFNKYRPNIVYHAAAHKHVPLMEDSPNEAIKNNVFGTLRTVCAADEYNVEKFVLISTDKAVNPTNVMGASKRICEMIVQTYNKRSKTEFVAVRFGNVLGSNGSVIPLFKKQIADGGPVKVTHPEIIRYFMTIPEAVSLVLQAGATAKGGEIFVLDMGEPVKILDLAVNLIRLSGFTPYKDIQIEFTGLRPGEKLYEELLMSEEGLQDTENKLIHIGKPIQFDEDVFLKRLDDLYKAAYAEEDIIPIIKEIVTTYRDPCEKNNKALSGCK